LGISTRAWSHDGYFGRQSALIAFDNFYATDSVPEPSGIAALLSLLPGIGLMARRR
jgi:hypothetical protein